MSDFRAGLFIIFSLLALSTVFDAWKCATAWEGSNTRYGIISGCLIEVANGKWIPSENYRQF